MIYAIDVKYIDDTAKTVCLGIHNWNDATYSFEKIEIKQGIEEYEPGAFYKRELPCILSILATIELKEEDILVVDGYVYLNDENKPGLGYYLFKSLKEKFPVIGVAKSKFFENTKNVIEVFRGESKNPLFVTAIGTSANTAGSNIVKMHGPFRLPTILQMLDKKTNEE